MQTLFSPDSKFMQALSRICDLLILNILFLLTSIPVFTIGASSAALYTVCFRFGTEREQGVVKSYFRAFRDNFRQGTGLWLLLLLFGGASLLSTMLMLSLSGPLHYLFLLFALLTLVAVLIGSCAFPLLSQFSTTVRACFKNALLLSIGYLPRFAGIAFINLFPILLFCFDLYLFFQTGFIWVAIYFSAGAYLNSLLMKKVFAPYLPPEYSADAN